jgi:hypothetical protein
MPGANSSERVASRFGEYVVAAYCDAARVPHAQWLIKLLEDTVRQSGRLAPGFQMDFGWVPLSLHLHAGELVICEPDFEDPSLVRLNPNITRSLSVQSDLLDVARAVGVRPTFSRYDQAVFVDANAWNASVVNLSRLRTVTQHDSGWLALAEGNLIAERFEQIRVCDLLTRKRAWLSATAPPPGTVVKFRGDEIDGVGMDASRANTPRRR